MSIYLYSWEGGVSYASTGCAEHIYIIITSTHEADNVIPNL